MQISFLQSPEWEQFQNSVGRKTWRSQGVLILQHHLYRFFNYLYCPHPSFNSIDQEKFFQEIRALAQKEKSIYIKIDLLKDLRFTNYDLRVKEVLSLQPQKTTILDLQKSEEELLRAMREKTRYNIRLAERKDVRITKQESKSKEAFEVFWRLLAETAEREGFSLHEKIYYKKLLEIKTDSFSNELFFAEFQGKVMAAALVNFYRTSGTVTYLHGCSSREYREVMAPHLLHWRVIQEAKKRNFSSYDFWGIDEKKWPGLTRFKTGFGGTTVVRPEAVDVVYRSFWYTIYKIAKKLRRHA